MLCTLCQSSHTQDEFVVQGRQFFHCLDCDLLFVDTQLNLAVNEERNRYRKHNNTLGDPGYTRFLTDFLESFCPYLHAGFRGLDYGAGPNPELSVLLRRRGMEMSDYDPFFGPAFPTDCEPFDFVTCCEVAEHFTNPKTEFTQLASLLRDGGILAVRTQLHDGAPSADWWYLRDITHRCFYSSRSVNWIAENYGFKICQSTKDGAIFEKSAKII